MLDISSSHVHYLYRNPKRHVWESNGPTVKKILKLDVQMLGTPGTHVCIFPEEAKVETLQETGDPLCEMLSNKFQIPRFFWSKAGWDANGFYGSQDNVVQDQDTTKSHSSFFRFLIKKVEIVTQQGLIRSMTRTNIQSSGEVVEYSWEFLGLYSIWTTNEDPKYKDTLGTQILLCFDFNKHMREISLEYFQGSTNESIIHDPFGVHAIFLEPLVIEYDRALWGFRTPVRNYEKSRLNLVKNEDVARSALARRYENMHELQRHIIHSSETLTVASTTLKAMLQDQASFNADSHPTPKNEQNTGKLIQLYVTFIGNLELRARAFEERLQNEIRLAFNTVAADDSATAKRLLEQSTGLLEQSKNDARSLTTTVSLLTLFFLPGTFIAGFFGTNFFSVTPGDGNKPPQWSVVSEVWVFFVVTAPITGIAFVAWYLDLIGKIPYRFPERPIVTGKPRGAVSGPGYRLSTLDPHPTYP